MVSFPTLDTVDIILLLVGIILLFFQIGIIAYTIFERFMDLGKKS